MIENVLLLFTKPAIPGRVKTRLIGALSPEDAARLHAAFQDDLLARLRLGSTELQIWWALEPGEALPDDPPGGRRQSAGGLGERLAAAFEANRDRRRAAVVGSDHPELPAERIEQAFEALDRGADVVFGPAEDGGYYLVALRPKELRREIFEGIPWSTDGVLAASLRACARLGLVTELLAPGHDVDRPEDLGGLARRLAATPELAPATWRLLERLPGVVPGGREG